MLALPLGVSRVFSPEFASIAPRRTVSDLIAIVRPDHADVTRLPVDQQVDVAAAQVKAVELVKLASAYVFAKNKIIGPLRIEMCLCHRVGIKGQLAAVASRHLHQMDLGDISKAGGNQHLAPLRVPASQTGTAKVAVPLHAGRQGSRNRRYTLRDQVLVRGNCVVLRKGRTAY